jgi:hypothetical protein
MKTYGGVGGISPLFLTSATDVDVVEQRKVFCSYRESNPSRPSRRYTDWAIPAPETCEVN